MRNFFLIIWGSLLLFPALAADTRQKVDFPTAMQEHMLGNMRDHLHTLDAILMNLNNNKLDKAAELAEQRLGMSSLDAHGASHMAKFMPASMQTMGTQMHHAASRFAIKAQEGDALAAYRAVQDITATCVACHDAFRIR
jgi:hypothetical protein